MRRSGFIFFVCILLLVAGGASLALLPATELPGMRGIRLNRLLALVLFFFSGGMGFLGMAGLRGACANVTALLADAGAAGKFAAIDCPHPDVQELVGAVNRVLDSAKSATSHAALRVKELEIQLKLAEAERKHAEAIIYSISDAVLVTDPFDEVVLANESAARTLGFELASANRSPVASVVADAAVVGLIRDMRQSDTRGGRRIVEHTVQTSTGERTYKVTLSRVSAKEQAGGGVVAVLHDMTREKEVAQMKNDFVSNVSHELRTPLASIKAYVEMLIDGEAADEKARTEFYEVIHNEANRLGRLIDNILNISRIESGLVKMNKKAQSLMVVLKDAVEVITPQARQKNIALSADIAPAFYETLIDRDMVYESILNLLSNAVKYTPEGGRVAVSTVVDESSKTVAVRIRDTGVGIPPKDLPFVFDKFYRSEANNAMAKGTGLGLSLVKHIIESVHQGRIFVESQVGKGSTFGFELNLL